MVIIVYLRFLFSPNFRQSCIYACKVAYENVNENYDFIQFYIQKESNLTNEYLYNQKKVQQINKKLEDPNNKNIVNKIENLKA